jgi:hypothetical protein
MGMNEATKFWEFFETMPKKVQLDYMNSRFGELAWDISRNWEDYQIEYDDLKKLKTEYEEQKKKKEFVDNENGKYGFFKIPSMVISRDDLISRFEGRDDFEEKIKEIKKISNEDMQFIANQMTDNMMETFWFALDEAYFNLKDIKKVVKNGK